MIRPTHFTNSIGYSLNIRGYLEMGRASFWTTTTFTALRGQKDAADLKESFVLMMAWLCWMATAWT
jgi:hypothetical protein